MTALAGLWLFDGAGEPLTGCLQMLKAQQVYGPERPATWSEGRIALGKRLFATLPEDKYDRGPLVGGGGRWTLAGDVRLDDREGLCEALGAGEAGILSDSALVMAAIERWGEEALGRLVGEFALALWDRAQGRLLLARDFMGQRPLHYHRGAGFFAFATMAKGLHALPEVPTGVDDRGVIDFLALLPDDGPRTVFSGIGRVPPGELLVVTETGETSRRHWNFVPAPLRLKRAEEYDEALREVFDRSVRARLRGAGGRVAAHLSGGLDSSVVAASAARLLAPDGKVTAFTAVPREGYDGRINRGRFADEGAHAAAVAALYPNMEHVLMRSGARSPFANLDRSFFLYERPVVNPCNYVWAEAIADEAKRRGLTVLLTGQMGNLSFSHSGIERLSGLLGSGRLLRLAREAFLLRRSLSLESIAAHAIGPFMPAPLWRAINRWRGRRHSLADYTALRPDLADALAKEAAARGEAPLYAPGDSVALRLLAVGRADPGVYQKGSLAGWGIDVRDPTADRRLIELCLSIPADQYLSGGQTRALARRAFSDRLPERIVRETRKGYQAADWHEGLAADVVGAREEVARIARVPAASAVDTARLTGLLETLPERDWNSHERQAHYRFALLRGISVGHFVRKATGSN